MLTILQITIGERGYIELSMQIKARACTWIKCTASFMVLTLFFLSGFWLRGIAAEQEIAAWQTIFLTPEPDLCALCGYGGGPRYHAPCLVNLSTGEVGEMRVYDPDPVRGWEVSGVQQTGTFSMLRCAGVTAARNTDAHTCTAELPRKADELIPAYFCRDCRGRIAEVSRRGFILADLYDLTDIQTYALSGEASYSIRGYDVSVSRRGGDRLLHVEITGGL